MPPSPCLSPPKGDDRLTLLYCTPLPPRWTVEASEPTICTLTHPSHTLTPSPSHPYSFTPPLPHIPTPSLSLSSQKELAAVLVSLGVVQGAVEVYQRLELWEEVATCYQAAGRRGRAEEVVRERLREHETPTLWCILGDVTQV